MSLDMRKQFGMITRKRKGADILFLLVGLDLYAYRFVFATAAHLHFHLAVCLAAGLLFKRYRFELVTAVIEIKIYSNSRY